MPIPKPKKSEAQDEYISRAIGFLVGEGMEQEQAAAIAHQQWRDRNKKKVKKTQFEFIKSIPMDMSFNEIRDAISSAASKLIDAQAGGAYVNDIYLDGTCIVEIYQDGNYKYYRYDYTFNSDDIVILTNPVEVVKDWEEVGKWSNDPKKVVKDKINVKKSEMNIFKKDLESKLIFGEVLIPETEDAQGDIISEEEIAKTARNFLVGYRQQVTSMGEMHKKEAHGVIVVESYLAPVDFVIEDKDIKKGTWIVVSKINDSKIWDLVKDGKYTGYSIGGRGKRIPVKEDSE